MKLTEIKLPAAVIHSEFACTNFDDLDDLSNLLAYCFEGAHSATTLLVDCSGWAYKIAGCTQHKQKPLRQLFKGSRSRIALELNRTKKLSTLDFYEVLTKRLVQNPEWWMNNDGIVDLDAVGKVFEASSNLAEVMQNLGWFSPEVY